jgi:tripartite-type tricarboxylate transporter receptor subunit TctC
MPKASVTHRLGFTRSILAAAATVLLAACSGTGSGSPSAGAGSPVVASPGGSPAASASAAASPASNYPEQPINVIVPFSAGGPTDTVTRTIAEPMTRILGQQVVVQNVTGAGGTVAAGQVAEAQPDGYTVLMHHIGMSTAPAVYPDLPFDPLVDFKTVGLVTDVPMTIVGRSDFEPTSLPELVDHVKANGEQVNYANAGPGAASHLCGLLFQDAVGTKVTEVEYPGTNEAMDDLLGKQVDFLCDQTTNTTQHIKAGSIKAYAITSAERNDALPEVPTTIEAGLPDVQVGVWHGLYVPKDTPDDIVQALSDALKEALKDEAVISKFAGLGTTPVAEDQATPDAHRTRLQEQIELWTPFIKGGGAP